MKLRPRLKTFLDRLGTVHQDSKPLVCAAVKGDAYVAMAEIWSKACRHVTPWLRTRTYEYDSECLELIGDDEEREDDLPKIYAGSKMIAQRSPLLITDVDVLFSQVFDYIPTCDQIVVAMQGGSVPVKGSLPTVDHCILDMVEEVGLAKRPSVIVSAWATWTRIDLLPLFLKWREAAISVQRSCGYESTPLGVLIHNLMWHDLRNQGRAELLPKPYVTHVWVKQDRLTAMREQARQMYGESFI